MLEAAESRTVKMYPTFYLKDFKLIITVGNLWELTFEIPCIMFGGVPIVKIDKRTSNVVRIIHTQ